MKIVIDKNVKDISKLKGHELVYLFDDETLDELLDKKLHCVKYNEYKERVDINLTKYDIRCKKKAKINDDNLFELPEHKDYKFSIIVPSCNNDRGNYNGKTFLRNCIESILNQTYKNFELIIVDDMSTDTSVETIKSYKDKRIRLIQNKRKRYNGGSRNVGIDAISEDTDYICFLDSDDWWKNNDVLKTINEELDNCDMMLIGLELIDNNGVFMTKFHEYNNATDFFLSDNKVWCTAWARVIRKDKIVYFCEDTLMEDRVWSYLQADNVDFDNIKNLKEVCYVWNRTNTGNSVSIVRGNIWNASAYCHIGHQLMLLDKLKHKEYIEALKPRIEMCKNKVNSGIYQQY